MVDYYRRTYQMRNLQPPVKGQTFKPDYNDITATRTPPFKQTLSYTGGWKKCETNRNALVGAALTTIVDL